MAESRRQYLMKVCGMILFVEMLERLCYYGMSTDLQVYLTKVMGYATAEATSLQTAWSGTAYIMPLVGGFVADAYLGRGKTIICFSCLYLLGLIGLTVSATPSIIPKDNVADSGQVACFWLSLYMIALGMGGIKPCVSSFGADQFVAGEETQRSSFFNYFYFCINVGSLVGTIGIVVILESIGWYAGYAICAVCFALALLAFVLGWPWYTKLPPSGSPVTRLYLTCYAAYLKRKEALPKDPKDLHELEGPNSVSAIVGCAKLPHSPGMAWLDKAAIKSDATLAALTEDASMHAGVIETTSGSFLPAWAAQITLTHVQEVKVVCSLLPILATNIVFQMIYSNIFTLFISQGTMIDTHIGSLNVPAAALSSIDTFAVLIGVLLYDQVLTPALQHFKRPISTLERIGIGYVFSTAAMLAAGAVETYRLRLVNEAGVQDDYTATVNLSWAAQIPEYGLVGLAEVFSNIGAMQLFYEAAPESLRSMCSALYLVGVGIAGYLSSALVLIIQSATATNGRPGWLAINLNEAHMDYFFWLLAGMQVVDIAVYVWVAKRYTRLRPQICMEEDVLLEQAEGAVESRRFSRVSSRAASEVRSGRSASTAVAFLHGVLPPHLHTVEECQQLHDFASNPSDRVLRYDSQTKVEVLVRSGPSRGASAAQLARPSHLARPAHLSRASYLGTVNENLRHRSSSMTALGVPADPNIVR